MSNVDLLLGREALDASPKRGRARRRAALPAPQEAAIQRAIIDACRWRGIMAVHVPNAGKRSVQAARRLKGEGMRKGFPDLALYAPGGRHMLMEVKRPRYSPSDVSDAQRDVHARLGELGQTVVIVTSVDDAMGALRAAGWVQ